MKLAMWIAVAVAIFFGGGLVNQKIKEAKKKEENDKR